MASLQDLLSALQNMSQGAMSGFGGFNNEPLPQLLSSHDINGIAEYIKSSSCKKISILAGAGISVSAGIPDFRSKGGFYNTLNLSKYQLTKEQRLKCENNPEYILSYQLFKENPNVYIETRSDIFYIFYIVI